MLIQLHAELNAAESRQSTREMFSPELFINPARVAVGKGRTGFSCWCGGKQAQGNHNSSNNFSDHKNLLL
jgi:hypothetical protein